MGTAAIVLAAGKGTRMKSDLPKVAHTVLGRPLVRWVVDAAHEAGIERVVTVVGYKREIVEELVAQDTEIAIQEEQIGTANAVLVCRDLLLGDAGAGAGAAGAEVPESVVVLTGDSPLITAGTIRALIEERERDDAAVVVLTMHLDDPTGYGRIIREKQEDGQGDVLRIVEQKDADADDAAETECNSGFYCFDTRMLFDALTQVGSENAQGEYYLTDVLEIARRAGRRVKALVAENPDECLGVNTPEQLADAERIKAAALQ